MRLLGKKAIVTGANRSIGKGIAIAFAEEGADVVVSYRSDEQGALQTVAEIEKRGRSGSAFYADFSKTSAIESFFNQARNALGWVDILVNNAAGYDAQPFLDVAVDTFQRVLQVGVTTAMHLTQLAAREMIEEKRGGNVINISSITGERPHPNRVAHASAKAALNMLTRCMALELAPYHIRVNGIAPGWTSYDESTIYDDEQAAQIPLKRGGTPRDQAHAALYLASEEAAWVTGQILTVDGGQSL